MTNLATRAHALIACPDCDLIHERRVIADGHKAKCARCSALLYCHPHHSVQRTLALAMACLLLFLVANLSHFMSFSLHGRVQESVLLTGIVELYRGGLWGLAVLVFFTSFLAPAMNILLLLALSLPLHFGKAPRYLPRVYRLYESLCPWAMISVYLLGVFVAIVKLADLASTPIGNGFYALVVLMFVMAAAQSRFDPESIWKAMEKRR
ncbi:MAG: paraquat-inducible protein A [Planctomycetota bacterium]|jgi:paraquat-inducible protein A